MHIKELTKDGNAYRITIPKWLIVYLGWRDKDKILIKPGLEDEIIIKRIPRDVDVEHQRMRTL